MTARAWPAFACILGLTSCQGADSSKWLVVSATRESLEPAIQAVNQVRKTWTRAAIVPSSDCANLKPGLYLAVVEVTTERAAAESAAAKLRGSVADAYVRNCEPRTGSLMQFGIPAVDPSVLQVPATAVNWDTEDRLSDIKAAGSGYVWIKRWYDPAPEDPLEGRRASVYFFDRNPREAKELAANCTSPSVQVSGGLAAITCVRENAGENLLHETRVVETGSGRLLKSIPRCRDARVVSRTEVSCQAEAVGPDGQLKLTPKRLPLS